MKSPILQLNWWRVCTLLSSHASSFVSLSLGMDESQEFKQGTKNAAKVLSFLRQTYTWAISGIIIYSFVRKILFDFVGTPLQRHLNSLRGSFIFLGLQPYAKSVFWIHGFSSPPSPFSFHPSSYSEIELPSRKREHENLVRSHLLYLMQRLMWRNTKKTALLTLPPPTFFVHRPHFTEVERYMYMRRFDTLRSLYFAAQTTIAAYERANRLVVQDDGKIKALGRLPKAAHLAPIVEAVNALRQLCCHPQLGTHTGFRALARSALTMEQLLQNMIEKARLEVIDEQRIVMNNCSSLAAIHVIQKQHVPAMRLYLEVVEEGKLFPVDSLQRIHALHHLLGSISHFLNEEKDDDQIAEDTSSLPNITIDGTEHPLISETGTFTLFIYLFSLPSRS